MTRPPVIVTMTLLGAVLLRSTKPVGHLVLLMSLLASAGAVALPTSGASQVPAASTATLSVGGAARSTPPRAQLAAWQVPLASGRVRVQLRTQSTRVRVTYLSKTQRRHVRVVRVSQGRAATTLPRGARATTARALATKKLRSSLTTPVPWHQTTPPTQDPTADTAAPRLQDPTTAPPNPTAGPRIQDPTTAPPNQNPSGVWRPSPGTSWQWQIRGAVDESLDVAMYDIDLFHAQAEASSYTVPGFGTVNVPKGDSAGAIDRLKAKGKVVICYLDTGAWEDYRPDAALFPAAVIGNTTGWSGEKWLDIRPAAWPAFTPLIEARLDLATRSGCDGVEPDQNNPWGNNPGFDISLADQKAWYLEVARMAHARGLSVGQKNGIETTDADTIAAFDWNLNEECNMNSECEILTGFIQAGKAVFQVEYTDEGATYDKACPANNARNFDGLLKTLALDTWRQPCR